jgi:hypothetical protein
MERHVEMFLFVKLVYGSGLVTRYTESTGTMTYTTYFELPVGRTTMNARGHKSRLLSYLRRTVQIDRKSGIMRSLGCFLSGPGSVMRCVRSYVLIV